MLQKFLLKNRETKSVCPVVEATPLPRIYTLEGGTTAKSRLMVSAPLELLPVIVRGQALLSGDPVLSSE